MKLSTVRHVKYAQGYAELGLFREAHAELAAIDPLDAGLPEVINAHVSVTWEAKQWESLIEHAHYLARRAPKEERGWIAWAYALRELGRIAEAKSVLLEAEPLHGADSAVLHYNLACYHCLLGELAEARLRLRTAFRMHAPFKEDARKDRDLEAIWGELEGNEG